MLGDGVGRDGRGEALTAPVRPRRRHAGDATRSTPCLRVAYGEGIGRGRSGPTSSRRGGPPHTLGESADGKKGLIVNTYAFRSFESWVPGSLEYVWNCLPNAAWPRPRLSPCLSVLCTGAPWPVSLPRARPFPRVWGINYRFTW